MGFGKLEVHGNPAFWRAYAPQLIPTPALVADVELTQPITPIDTGTNYRAARILVRLHGCPVGYVDLLLQPSEAIDQARILAALPHATREQIIDHLNSDGIPDQRLAVRTGKHLATLLAEVAQLECRHRTILNNTTLVTIAICTRNRSHSISATLDSLLCQTYRNSEIVVVDNAPSSDATADLIRDHYPSVRYVREECVGLDNARNRAVIEARGQIVAFIDDDAIADPLWAESLVATFDTPDVMCVAGLVAPLRLDNESQELFERFGYSKGFTQLRFSLAAPPPIPGFPYKGYLGTGCNSAFRRSVFEHIGLFDPCLDMGTPVPGGGDHDMFTRIVKAGYTLVYDPRPVVFHDHIDDISVLTAKLGEYQRAFMAYLTKHIIADRAFLFAAYVLWRYIRKTYRGLASVLIKHNRSFALVKSEAINFWLGPVALYRSCRLEQQRLTVSQENNDDTALEVKTSSSDDNAAEIACAEV